MSKQSWQRSQLSRCPSQRQKTLHVSHVTRFACGPADEPMTPITLPQVHACGSFTFMPTIDEADGDADDGAGGDSNRSSCNIAVVPYRHRLRDVPNWDYARFARNDVVPIDDGLGIALARSCPRPLLLGREVVGDPVV